MEVKPSLAQYIFYNTAIKLHYYTKPCLLCHSGTDLKSFSTNSSFNSKNHEHYVSSSIKTVYDLWLLNEIIAVGHFTL